MDNIYTLIAKASNKIHANSKVRMSEESDKLHRQTVDEFYHDLSTKHFAPDIIVSIKKFVR